MCRIFILGVGEPVACAGFFYWGCENLWRVQDFYIGGGRTCVCAGLGEPVLCAGIFFGWEWWLMFLGWEMG